MIPSVLASNPAAEGRFFIDLVVILATAAVIATIFKRMRLETIPGYLVAGAIVGPHALRLVSNVETVEQISHLAIILLMFTIGLMLETASLKRGMMSILAVGLISTLLVVLFSWPLVVLLGPSAPQGLVIAMAFSMSSTAVLLRILQQRRELRQPHGQLCLGISIVQDILSVVLMAALPLIVAWDTGAWIPTTGPGQSLHPVVLWGLRLTAMACIIILGRIGIPKLLHFVANSDDRSRGTGSAELVLVTSSALAVGAALVLGSLRFSPEMGAFLAGFMLSFTPFRHQLAGQLAPMKDLLMAIFFTSVGLRLDPAILAGNWPTILFGVSLLVIGKTAITAGTAWALGASGSVAVLGAAYLANAGEFSLVIVSSAADAGLFEPTSVATAIAIVVVSLVVSPLLIGPAHALAMKASSVRLAPWVRASVMRAFPATVKPAPTEAETGAEDPGASSTGQAVDPVAIDRHKDHHVIIAGYGPVGRSLADRLSRRGVPITVIELNPRTVQKQATLGRSIVYGDVTNAEVLESAGIREADALVIAIPDEMAVLRACQMARALVPGLFIAARASFLSQAIKARQMGADSVIVEEIVTAEAMAALVTELLEARRAEPSSAGGA